MKKLFLMIAVLCIVLLGIWGCRPDDVSDDSVSVGGFDQNGASNAVFSVALRRTVHFSKGNLQYQASTGTWRFAEHQYDCIGNDNANISSTYSGWIDLFGWGTSGWNSSANAYQPWSTDTSFSAYYPGGEYTNNLIGDYANADWGVYNRISNGGNQTGMWRTLTKDEWEYLLNTRSASTACGYGNVRYAKATVNNVQGLIIFPDVYIHPNGVATLRNVNESGSVYTAYVLTMSEWDKMQSAGCIFLPAAGGRDGFSVVFEGSYGLYWSSSYVNEFNTYSMGFYSGYVGMSDFSRGYGFSVRLVKD